MGATGQEESVVLAKISPGIFIRATMINPLIDRLPGNYLAAILIVDSLSHSSSKNGK